MRMKRLFPVWWLLGLTPLIHAVELGKSDFDIPAQDAVLALKRFTDQSGQEIIYSPEVVRGVRTNGINGAFAPREALALMLKDTGLVASQGGNKILTIKRDPDAKEPKTMRGPVPPLLDNGVKKTAARSDLALVLDPVVVTAANRTAKEIDRIPGTVSLIRLDEVEEHLAVTEDVTKLLERSLPGYSPSRGSRFTFGETLRGRRPLYLIDGIPQSTPLRDGGTGAYFVDLSLIERVEVINGPSATEGLGAAGGIINYITKQPRKGGREVNFDTKITSQLTGNNPGWRAGFNFMHSQEGFDVLVGVAFVSRELDYDAHSRPMGVDNFDTMQRDIFVKIGSSFGPGHNQRVQFSANNFDYVDNGRYVQVYGDRALGLTNSGLPGIPPGRPQNQLMRHASLDYANDNILGGTLKVQLYRDRQSALNPTSIDVSKQDAAIAPLGSLVDQSDITAKKYGVRSIFVRPDFLLPGLEADLGIDYLKDETAQSLALTGRAWVPPLRYASFAPFAQLEYEYGPVTFRGGVRQENARLRVDSFTTIATANRTFVAGGKLSFAKELYNLGGIYRLGGGWSVYAAYSEGFGVPDIGLVLRGISVPNQSVSSRANLTPLIITNKEAGVNWRGRRGSFGMSAYRSYSAVGSSLTFDPASQAAVLNRTPTRIDGVELTAEGRINERLTLAGIYSRIVGKTSFGSGYPLNVHMSADQIPPVKLMGVLRWAFSVSTDLKLTAIRYQSRHVNTGIASLAGANLQEDFDGYGLVDATIEYRTKRFGTWTLGVENLLNRYYIQAISSSNVVSSQNPPYYLSGRGRAVALSNRIRF